MSKNERIAKVENIRTGEIYLTSSLYEKSIDGVNFIGVWKENDKSRRINWMRQDSLRKIKK